MSQAAQVVILIAFLALVGAEVVDIDSSCSPAIQGETDESLNLVQLRASKDSLQDTANSTSLYSMFDAMDENRDHQVSLEEAWQHLDQESWSKVTDVFGKIDADHDGIISSSDLQKRAGKNGENAAELNSILTKKRDFEIKIPLARLSWRRARGRTAGVMSCKALSDVTCKIMLTLKPIS